MDVKRGDIWLVNLDPTIGNEIKKSRPAVIIQNDLGNKLSPIILIAPLTSQHLERVNPIEVLVLCAQSGLAKDSKALLNQIRAVDKQRLVKRLGKMNETTLEKINDALKISFGLIKL